MHNEITIVDQHPFGCLIAFYVRGAPPGFREPFCDLICDRLHLSARLAAADDKVVCKGGYSLQIENNDLSRLLVACRAHCGFHPLVGQMRFGDVADCVSSLSHSYPDKADILQYS